MNRLLFFPLGVAVWALTSLSVPATFAADTVAAAKADAEALDRLYFGDEIVESATRAPKPLRQIPENVTVVTAAEIEAMNAHSLAEVLNRVTGVFIEFQGTHLGAIALPHIQGGTGVGRTPLERHTLLLLDGMPWNSLGHNIPLSTIPVGIIDRIEVIKGPASSTWGSALGGVVNVLTKKPGKTAVPAAAFSGSYGERDTRDLRGEAAGAAGPVGYYVQGQGQHADYDDAGAEFRDRALFAKADARLGRAVTLNLSAGSSRPEHDAGRLATFAALAQDKYRSRFVQAGADARLGETLTLYASAFRRDYELDQPTQEDGTYAPAGSLLQNNDFVEKIWGASARAAWTPRGHAVVAGVDYQGGDLKKTTDSGDYYQSAGFPTHEEVDATIDRLGVYANDTLTFGPLTVVPGLRHDRASKGGSFTSPSLGATLQLGASTVARASLARGFAAPTAYDLAVRSHNQVPNSDLKPEKVFSWQGGVEAQAWTALWLKASVFRHEVSDTIFFGETSPGSGLYTNLNGGASRRTGAEVEAETAAWQGLSASAGFAFVRVHEVGKEEDADQHQVNLGLRYRRGTFHADLFGHYVWWDAGPGLHEGSHNDLLWDLTASKGFALGRGWEAEVFGTLHNLGNGDQNLETNRGTESRWVEVGLRLTL